VKLELVTNDMYGDKTRNLYELEKVVNDRGTNYKYTCENGIKNDIYFLEKKVLMNRVGEISTKQVYDLYETTKSIYKTPYMETELLIKTLKYEKTLRGFHLFYRIYANVELLNEITVDFNEI